MATTYLEEHEIQIKMGLEEGDWETLQREFQLFVSTLPMKGTIKFSLSPRQSALFTERDIPRLLAATKGPLRDPRNWHLLDLYGRTTLVFEYPAGMEKEDMTRERALEFIKECVRKGRADEKVKMKTLWEMFCHWMKYKYPDERRDNDVDFHDKFITECEHYTYKIGRNFAYKGFKVIMKNIPPFKEEDTREE